MASQGEGPEIELVWKSDHDSIYQSEMDFYTTKPQKTVNNSSTSLREIFNILIPSEVTNLIFKRLNLKSKQSSRAVSKKWLELVDPLLKWSPFLSDESSSQVLTFAQKGKSLESLIIGNLKDFDYPFRGIGWSYVKELKFGALHEPFGPTDLKGISEQNLNRLLYDLCSVTGLSLHSSHFRSIDLPSSFRVLDFPLLSSLEITALSENARGYYVCADVFYQTFPMLNSISLTFQYQRETILHQHPPFYKEIFQFVIRHKKTLANFHLNFKNLADERSLPQFVFDLDHTIPARDYLEIMSELSDMNGLREISFEPSFYEGRARYNFATQLMNQQSHLTTLKLTNLSRLNFAIYSKAMDIIPRCSNTLKFIEFDGCFCPEARPLDQFSCHVLQSCKKLVDFRISICGLKIVDVAGIPGQVEAIHLGQGLSMGQINYIATTLTNLREWYLPQDRGQYDRRIPKTSVSIFKIVVKMPRLEKLILTKRCSSWKRIRKVISYTQGLKIGEKELKNNDSNMYVKIMIDRNRLELDRL